MGNVYHVRKSICDTVLSMKSKVKFKAMHSAAQYSNHHCQQVVSNSVRAIDSTVCLNPLLPLSEL